MDWSHILSFAAGSAMTALLRALFVALVREPAQLLMSRHQIVRWLSKLWPPKHAALSGPWEFEWRVDSENFPSSNKDRVELHKFLQFFAAELRSRTQTGAQIRYGFVGRMHGSIVTGNWYDVRDAKRGYYGSFQVVMGGTMQRANGKWLGFSQDGSVKTGELIWSKLPR